MFVCFAHFLLPRCAGDGMSLVLQNYVRGHSDDTGNTEADRLAVAATRFSDVPTDTDTDT